MTTTLGVDVDEHTEINLIDLRSGAVAESVPAALDYDYLRWTTDGFSGAGDYSTEHVLDDLTNWMVIGFITNTGYFPPITNVKVNGVAAVFEGQAKNSYFGIDSKGIALYTFMAPAGLSGSVTVSWTHTGATSSSPGGIGIVSGYAASGNPMVISSFATDTGTGNRSYIGDPEGELGTGVRLCANAGYYPGINSGGYGGYRDLAPYCGGSLHGICVDPPAARTTSWTYSFITEVSASVAWAIVADGGADFPSTAEVEISTPTLTRDDIITDVVEAADISESIGHDDSIEVTVEEAF